MPKSVANLIPLESASIQESPVGSPDIFQSPAVYKTPAKLRESWNSYLEKCINNSKMPTKAGTCFALKIRRKEWDTLRTHKTLGPAIDWIETVIEDTWLQKLISTGASAGAWNYLKSHYPEQYGDTANIAIGNLSLSVLLVKAHERLRLKQND